MNTDRGIVGWTDGALELFEPMKAMDPGDWFLIALKDISSHNLRRRVKVNGKQMFKAFVVSRAVDRAYYKVECAAIETEAIRRRVWEIMS